MTKTPAEEKPRNSIHIERMCDTAVEVYYGNADGLKKLGYVDLKNQKQISRWIWHIDESQLKPKQGE